MLITKDLIDFISLLKKCFKSYETVAAQYNGCSLRAVTNTFHLSLNLEEAKTESIMLSMICLNYISTFPIGANVQIKKDGKLVDVKCKRSHTTFPLLDYDMMNNEIKTDDYINLSAIEVALLRDVSTAADRNAPKPLTTALHIKTDNDKLVAYAIDGHKLAYCNLMNSPSEKFFLNIREDYLNLVFSSGLFKNGCKVYRSDNLRKVIFATDEASIAIPMVDCADFDYNSVINSIKVTTFKFKKNVLLDVIKRLNTVLASDKLPIGIFEIKEDLLKITVNSVVFKGEEIVEIHHDNDFKNISIGVNLSDLRIALSCMKNEELSFLYSGELSPFIITDGKLNYLIMPSRYSRT